VYNNALQTGPYTVTEGADPAGFKFESVSCTVNGTTTDLTDPSNARKVNITLNPNDNVVCIYTNKQLVASSSSAQRWLPNDRVVLTTNDSGTTLNGTLTVTLYHGTPTVTAGVCTAGSATALSGQSYQFPVSNATSPAAFNTTNTTFSVGTNSDGTAGGDAGNYFWLIHYHDNNISSPADRCESSNVSITDG
jgi:hypothetical protein